jgi:hypothetical protein
MLCIQRIVGWWNACDGPLIIFVPHIWWTFFLLPCNLRRISYFFFRFITHTYGWIYILFIYDITTSYIITYPQKSLSLLIIKIRRMNACILWIYMWRTWSYDQCHCLLDLKVSALWNKITFFGEFLQVGNDWVYEILQLFR